MKNKISIRILSLILLATMLLCSCISWSRSSRAVALPAIGKISLLWRPISWPSWKVPAWKAPLLPDAWKQCARPWKLFWDNKRLPRSAAVSEWQRTPKPAKTSYRIGGLPFLRASIATGISPYRQSVKSLAQQGVFALLRKSAPTVPPVRRRGRFACLWRFFAPCQAVKSPG